MNLCKGTIIREHIINKSSNVKRAREQIVLPKFDHILKDRFASLTRR